MKMLKASILFCFYSILRFFYYLWRESHGRLGKRMIKEKLIYLLLCITEPTLRTELRMTGVKSIACA